MKRLAGIVLLIGCVGEAPPEPAPPNPVPAGGSGDRGSGETNQGMQTAINATSYLTQIAMIQCQQAFNCRATYPSGSTSFDTAWSTSVSSCVGVLQSAWAVGTIESEIAKGRIEYDGAAAVDCLAGVGFDACDTHWNNGIQWAESCYSVMVGNVPSGGSCESLYSCESYVCDDVEHRCL
jgi:hypothetical protein